MKLSDRYDGTSSPFEGDRIILLKTIPLNARIQRATATVTPIDATEGVNPFAETITFNGTAGNWGATKIPVPQRWVEVDFHNRRTLASVTGANLNATTLQVDLGGAYVEININGGIKAPDDGGPFALTSNSGANPLPGLTATKLKLTNPPLPAPPPPPPDPASPDITQVVIRSTPTNVSLRLGEGPAFWTHLGELTRFEEVPDFGVVLQAFLSDAKDENGFYQVPLVLHSDTIARLVVALEIEFLIEQSVLPTTLNAVVLPFDLSGLPQGQANVLEVEVPPNSRLAAEGTSARVKGVFEDTRIVRETDPAGSPSGAVEVSPTLSQAQPIIVSNETLAIGVDLLVKVTRPARLQLDLRKDLDGKPDLTTLLSAPVEFEIPGPVGQEENGATPEAPEWIGVRLPAEFKFESEVVYWLVLQSVEGEVALNTMSAPEGTLGMQYTDDGSLSWRETKSVSAPGPLRAFFRLRRRPPTFEVPIELQIGTGQDAVKVNLDRFQALGQVDFALEASDFVGPFNQYLAKIFQSKCQEIELLSNGDFEQWLRVGDSLAPPAGIDLQSTPISIAFAPDGSWAYAGMRVTERLGMLQVIDALCNVVTDTQVTSNLIPRTILISPDGVRAYVTDNKQIQLIDTTRHQALGTFSPRAATENAQIETMVLSPDGARLYVIVHFEATNGGGAASTKRELQVIDTAKLESAVTLGQPTVEEVKIDTPALQLEANTTAIAISPDESHLFAIEADNKLLILNTADLRSGPEEIDAGPQPQAIAVSPDGRQLVVANNSATDNLRFFVALNRGGVFSLVPGSPPLTIASGPFALSISQDGRRAYVLSRGDASGGVVTQIDLTKHRIIDPPLGVGADPTALAVSEQDDHIYVGITRTATASARLDSIQIGSRAPADWSLTSGRVQDLCLSEPFRQTALLGSEQTKPGAPPPRAMPTSLSQVVPVAEKCPYEFSFLGIATQDDASAEVFWLNSNCGLLQTDQIPIGMLPIPKASPGLALLISNLVAEQAPVTLHRKRLTAPATATQAEVRFNAPPSVVVALDSVSLMGTNETIQNADLKLQQEPGRLANWNLSPAIARGVSLRVAEDGVELRNAGRDTVELIQTAAAQSNQPFTLELQGRTDVRPTAQADPTVELVWLGADGKTVAAPTILQLTTSGFENAVASGVSPAGAAQVEIHIKAPAATTQEIKRVSLRFLPTTKVPVQFVSQAPGELTVLDWRVAFEQAEATPLPIPPSGPCPPTPPNGTPGEGTSCSDDDYCPECESEQMFVENTSFQTLTGRPAVLGLCSNCGSEVVRSGAAADLGLVARPLGAAVVPTLTNFAGLHRSFARNLREEIGIADRTRPFAGIKGIGIVRTKQLIAIGIDSIELLAAAEPADVMHVKGILPKLAANFIAQARQVLETRRTSK